ncbi:MAG: hypothetical protein ACTSW1_12030 [Candidatus Hodarchaeales archaeon]
MTKNTSKTGLVLALIGFLIPSFVLFWTGNEAIKMYLGGAYLFLWGYVEYDLGIFGTFDDSGLQIFNLNWYLDPDNIYQTTGGINDYLNGLATAMFPGNFTNDTLDISGMIFGISLIVILIVLILGFLGRTSGKTTGLGLIVGGLLAILALLLVWDNATHLSLIGPSIKDNYFPIPLGSALVLLGGYLTLKDKN